MKKLDKIAAQDAYDYGFAQMFFGEGAGTKRKFIGNIVDQKMQDIPGYSEAFDKAFGELNQIEIAEAALKHRKALDRSAKAARNFRAARSGNYGNLTNGIAAAVCVYVVLYNTGYDKKIEAEAKKAWLRVKTEYKARKAS